MPPPQAPSRKKLPSRDPMGCFYIRGNCATEMEVNLCVAAPVRKQVYIYFFILIYLLCQAKDRDHGWGGAGLMEGECTQSTRI